MKTIEITAEEMPGRISRYDALKPLPIQQDPEISAGSQRCHLPRASCSR